MPQDNKMKNTLEDAARSACEAVGIDYKPVPIDGLFHTADLTGDPRGKNDGRIKIFTDLQGGIVWNHKGIPKTFFVDDKSTQPITQADRERIQRERLRSAAELDRRHDRAAHRAKAIWQAAKAAPFDHPYLIHKRIKPYGARIAGWRRTLPDEAKKHHTLIIGNSLILPLYSESGIIRSLQAIFPEKNPELSRAKDFLPGGAVAGLFWWIGARSNPVCLAEGFATAATIHEATGYRVYIAFTAGNLVNIARLIRKKIPDTELIICADNDSETKGNPGLSKATQAALAVDARLAMPPIAGDFNDYENMLRSR
jgi:putative DNA primase/helicase